MNNKVIATRAQNTRSKRDTLEMLKYNLFRTNEDYISDPEHLNGSVYLHVCDIDMLVNQNITAKNVKLVS